MLKGGSEGVDGRLGSASSAFTRPEVFRAISVLEPLQPGGARPSPSAYAPPSDYFVKIIALVTAPSQVPLPPDLPDLRPTYKAQVGQTQVIDKHALFTIRPTARLIFEKICFKGEFHIISAPPRQPQPRPATPHSAINTPFSLYTPENRSGRSGRSGGPPENGSFPPF
jgi:hypothetical protein